MVSIHKIIKVFIKFFHRSFNYLNHHFLQFFKYFHGTIFQADVQNIFHNAICIVRKKINKKTIGLHRKNMRKNKISQIIIIIMVIFKCYFSGELIGLS